MAPYRILLADPDTPVVALHQNFLARRGYAVAVCADGLGCLELLRGFRPDLLVLDPDLPWGRGEGVLGLMADGDVPAVPVVLVSANLCPPRFAPAGRSPVQLFLPKPVPPHRLEESIRRALRAAAGRHHVRDERASTDLEPTLARRPAPGPPPRP
jgi:DNA-binding NtrC family response regulator